MDLRLTLAIVVWCIVGIVGSPMFDVVPVYKANVIQRLALLIHPQFVELLTIPICAFD